MADDPDVNDLPPEMQIAETTSRRRFLAATRAVIALPTAVVASPASNSGSAFSSDYLECERLWIAVWELALKRIGKIPSE